MRIENWHSKDIFQGFIDKAEQGANAVMDEVVAASKAKLAGLVSYPPIVREGKFSSADVSFTPKTGKDKNQLVQFHTNKRWMGRHKTKVDTLVETIRRVNKTGSGNVRVYAGNFKAYWAFMIEKGSVNNKAYHFLQEPFHSMKSQMVKKIASGGK